MTAIGHIRRERGLTREQFATAVGRSLRTVGGWECGKHRPSDDIFPKIAETLGCDIAIIWIPPKEMICQRRARSAEEEAAETANRKKAAPYVERRTALGLTKTELSKRAGVGESTLRDMESGRTFPRWETRQKIRQVLGMPKECCYTAEERNAIFLELQKQGVIRWAIHRNMIPLRAVHADLEDLEQELIICVLRAIDRFQPEGAASIKTFVEKNVDLFIRQWTVRVVRHGLSGRIQYPLPNITVVSLDALMEAGYDPEG